MHKNSYSKMTWFKNSYLKVSEKLDILDVGSLDNSGEYNYRAIFNEPNWTYTGLDIEAGNNVDIVVTDIYNWFEVEDNSFDVIVSGQFFEHLEFFWFTMGQIEKALRPGGYVCIIVPSSGPNHGGKMPNCYRFHEDGLKALAKYVSLDVIHISVDDNPEANPWNDACLVAYKPKDTNEFNDNELENRVNTLEDKLNVILENIKDK